jgi:hypothetical protein
LPGWKKFPGVAATMIGFFLRGERLNEKLNDIIDFFIDTDLKF